MPRPDAALVELSPCSASSSAHPKALLPLVPFVGMKLHMAAIHSHGWRFRLVRPYQIEVPTRLTLKTTSIRSPARMRESIQLAAAKLSAGSTNQA